MKASFLSKVRTSDGKGNVAVVNLYRLENGGVIGVDESYIETEEPVYSPFDKNVKLEIDESGNDIDSGAAIVKILSIDINEFSETFRRAYKKVRPLAKYVDKTLREDLISCDVLDSINNPSKDIIALCKAMANECGKWDASYWRVIED